MRIRFKGWSFCRRIPVIVTVPAISKLFVKMFYKMWRQEFNLERFKINYYPPEHFTTCYFQKTERVVPAWLAYRTILFLYFLITLLYAAIPVGKNIAEEDRFKFLIFLTHWTYIVEFVQFCLAFVITVIQYRKEKKNPQLMPMDKISWLYQLYWVLFTIALPSSIVVSVIFWVSVYDPVLFPANFLNVMLHASNGFFMVIDFALVGFPVRFLHFYWPVLYGLIYALFSVTYQLSGGTGVKGLIPIYNILDWRYPDKAIITCIMCVAFVLILHLLFSLLSMWKSWSKKSTANQ